MEQNKEHKIVVLGSASADFFFKLDRLPQVGETLDSRGLEKSLGGKGANQAVQCGKVGAPVEMLVQLGDDEPGRKYIELFNSFNVCTKNAKLLKDFDTGQAYILSLPDGNNSIFINGASNAAFDPEMKELDPAWADTIKSAKILLLQREIPEYVNAVAARTAKQSGTQVILDVGGRNEPMTEELLQNIDIISPNETELERVINKKINGDEELRHEIEIFIRKYPHIKVLLKKGEFGSAIYWLEDDKIHEVSRPAYSFSDYPQLKLIDTTGAGDCFTAAFTCKYLEGESFDKCLEFGSKAGFLCITKFGAGPAIPFLRDIEAVFSK